MTGLSAPLVGVALKGRQCIGAMCKAAGSCLAVHSHKDAAVAGISFIALVLRLTESLRFRLAHLFHTLSPQDPKALGLEPLYAGVKSGVVTSDEQDYEYNGNHGQGYGDD